MTDPIRAFMQANSLESRAFQPTSRYYGLATADWTRPDGVAVRYVRRRIVPPSDRFALLQVHEVTQGDRLDNLAATYLGDPEHFWRLCDANGAIRPDELTDTVGAHIRITLPEGIPGVTDA